MKPLETIATPEVDAAIARVLAAEQAARQSIEQCEAEARRRVQAAQLKARAIAERAAQRVARVHHWTDFTIAVRAQALDAERESLAHADLARTGEADRVVRTLEQFARELAESA
jgi:hypothetical protein